MANTPLRRVFAYPQISWFPGHMHKTRKELYDRLTQVDLFLEIRDARCPYSSANPMSDSITARKKTLVLLNKSDLCCLSYTKMIMQQMKSEGLNVMLFSTLSKHNLTAMLKTAEKIAPAKYKTVGTWMMVGGIPNTGKSSIINTLRKKSQDFDKSSIVKVGPKPGVTKTSEGFKVSENPLIYVVDSPGVMSPQISDPETGMKLALTGALRDGVVDGEVLCDYLFFVMNKLGCHQYVEKYGLERPTDVTDQILKKLERDYGRDRASVCRVVLTHYRTGKLGKLTLDKVKLIT